MLHSLENEEPRLEEAYENLRLIREMMERSTKHSSLSGRSGLLVGLWAVLGVVASRFFIYRSSELVLPASRTWQLAAVWLAVLFSSVLTDYLMNKRAAAAVGKEIVSPLGGRIVQAAAPGFTAGLVFTLYLLSAGLISHIWAFWMLSYGLAICSVGLFSVKPVTFLGWAFVAAGALTLFMSPISGLWMMAVTFGGFHVSYGVYTGITRGEW